MTKRSVRPIQHESRRGVEELSQQLMNVARKGGLFQGVVHQCHPAITRELPDCKGGMAHAQPGMTALFYIRGRPAETIDQEVAQALLGSL